MSNSPVKAAARAAETAADDAVRATGLAIDAAKEAERHAQAIEKVAPDPHKAIIRELASHEGARDPLDRTEAKPVA